MLRTDVYMYCNNCHICQKTKNHKKKYGYLPEKVIETDQWEVLFVDLIGHFMIRQPDEQKLQL